MLALLQLLKLLKFYFLRFHFFNGSLMLPNIILCYFTYLKCSSQTNLLAQLYNYGFHCRSNGFNCIITILCDITNSENICTCTNLDENRGYRIIISLLLSQSQRSHQQLHNAMNDGDKPMVKNIRPKHDCTPDCSVSA